MSSDITVVSRTQHIVVDPVSNSVSVANAGPAGPGGPPGVGGTAGGTSIVDVGGHFIVTNVEDALQALAEVIYDRDASIVDHETRLGVAEAKIVDNDVRIAANENALPVLDTKIDGVEATQALTNASLAADIAAKIDPLYVDQAIQALQATQATINQATDDLITTNSSDITQNETDIVDLQTEIEDLKTRLDTLENP